MHDPLVVDATLLAGADPVWRWLEVAGLPTAQPETLRVHVGVRFVPPPDLEGAPNGRRVLSHSDTSLAREWEWAASTDLAARRLFAEYDADATGRLTFAEFRSFVAALRAVGGNIADAMPDLYEGDRVRVNAAHGAPRRCCFRAPAVWRDATVLRAHADGTYDVAAEATGEAAAAAAEDEDEDEEAGGAGGGLCYCVRQWPAPPRDGVVFEGVARSALHVVSPTSNLAAGIAKAADLFRLHPPEMDLTHYIAHNHTLL